MGLCNALTIDLEDWFQVSNLEGCLTREQWDSCEFRLRRNTDFLLDLLNDTHKKATFFILGWNAERYPSLVRDIAQCGHEVATHGYSHELVYTMTQAEFRDDLRRSIDVIESAADVRVRGHRAASFSLTERCLWALEIMAAEGITYDSSMFPIKHDRYGVSPHWNQIRDIVTRSGSVVEVPITPFHFMGTNLPFSGGGYFRLLPYPVVKRITRTMNRCGNAVVFYFHPWEMDNEIPRFRMNMLKSFRCYLNIASNAGKFAALLRDFDFAPISEVLKQGSMQIRTLRCSTTERWMLL